MKHLKIENCAYFISTSTYKRKRVFSFPQYAQIVMDAILHGNKMNWYYLLSFVVMPDHIHLIVIPRNKNVPAIMKSLKGFTSRQINMMSNTKGKLWQERYHDLTMDNINFVNQKLRYIEENPVRAGLVENSVDYPFSSVGKYDEHDLSSLY